jgi:large subunit ribosomal protein L7/L12
MADLKAFAEQLVNLTVKEVSELADILKNDYGIEPAAAAVAIAAPAGDAAAAPVEEKTEFDLVLNSAGANKLQVIKLVKDKLGLSLGDAKALVDSAPCTLKAAMPKADAEALKAVLAENGAEAELK